MHSSWFQKPVHKPVRFLAAFSFAACVSAIWLGLTVWIVFLAVTIILMAVLIGSSFIIRSGVYVTTINSGNPESNQVAITFDDGPCEQTKELLMLLQNHHAKASFFLIGKKIRNFEGVVRLIQKENHTIGNHSFSHNYFFPLMIPYKISKEIADTQQIIKSAIGIEPLFFRPPFGITNPLVAKALRSTKLKTIGWSVRSLDTVTSDPGIIVDRIKNKIKPGSIILLHDTSQNVIPVLEELLIFCAKNNLKPVSLDDFLQS